MQLVLRQLRRAALAVDGADLTDTQLLRRFAVERDGCAFEALVRRHGPMVFGVCRRVVGHVQDAEDAFQATFLVLARHAGSVARGELLGNWLYGVACRTALKARSVAERRRRRESPLEDELPARGEPERVGREWVAALDQEVNRLPEKYRVPVVLCEFEGRTRREAARDLKLPEGTLSSRLAAARRLLARRLTRRGLVLPVTFLTAADMSGASAASISVHLLETTVHSAESAAATPAAVAALTKGVMQAMFMSKFKAVGLGALVAFFGLGVSSMLFRHAAHAEGAKPAKPAAAKPEKPQKPDANAANKPEKKPQGPSVQGVVKAVDATKKSLTLTVRVEGTKQTEEKTFPVADGAPVVLMDVLSKEQKPPMGMLGDLTEGVHVTGQLSADGKSLASIAARGPDIHGSVKAIDPAKGTITVAAKEGKGLKEYTLELAKGLKVFVDDGIGDKKTPAKEGQLADVGEDVRVSVQLSVNQKTALAIRAQGPTLSGSVKGYDVGTRTLTLTVKEDAQVVDKTLTVAKGAKVTGELAQGARVAVRLAFADKTTATAVHVVDGDK